MAKYQKYAEYKDSGEDWLGEIPVNWDLKKHKYIAIFSKGKNPDLLVDQYSSGLYPYLSMDSLRGKSESKYAEYKKGLVLVKDNQPLIIWDGSNSGEFVLGKKGILSSTMASASLVYEIDNKFYWYTCICIEPEMRKHATGMGIPHVNGDELRSISLPLPSLNEQEKIANFLDHETAQIDTLIAKQEKLIELLKEKRQAVISHAVTKGLNPNVPMKDSGVEWLGEVPEHWVITPIRNLIRSGNLVLQDGNHGELHPTANDYVEEGIPFLMANNIRAGKLLMGDVKRIPKHIADKLRIGFAKTGDMLLTHKGTVGEVALIPPEIQEEYWMLTPQVTYYRWNNQKFFNKYFYYQFQSTSIQNQLEIIGGKQSTRAYVGLIAQGDLIVVIPPKNEQIEIATNIFDKDQSYQVMIEKAKSAIQLMQERRTVLISAAVTGKIDVRHWQHPNQNNNNNTELSA